MVVTLVCLAIYVSSGRLVMRALSTAQPEIVEMLSSMADGEVSIDGIQGRMVGFSPHIQIENFALRDDANGEWVNLPALSIRIDAWASLLAGTLRFDEIVLTKPEFRSLPMAQRQEHAIPRGMAGFLNGFERLVIREARVRELPRAAGQLPLTPAVTLNLDMVREGSRRDLKISIHSDEGVVFATEGSGTGDLLDYEKFSGAFHGYFSGRGLGMAAQMLGVDLTAEGSASFWLRVSQEGARVTLQTDLENISQATGDRVMLEALSFSAALEALSGQQQLWVQNAKLTHSDSQLALHRLQLAKSDGDWQILVRDFEISPLIEILVASGVLPERASQILATLDPNGRVEALSLEMASLMEPLQSWSTSIVVENATTQPYRNVPGLGGIDASLVANQSGAQAWILTEDFSLTLPKVYESSIQFDAVTGVLSAHWQPDALWLEDGLFLAVASDHAATVQFEMDIPFFKNASIERHMRLAAAVSDAPMSVRNSYIPYRLPTTAYQWLQNALPAGHIEAATFMWFGDFRPYGHPSQTMQLAANLRDVALAYQGDWPAALQPTSFLRLDDTLIDVWSPYTRIAGLELDHTFVGLRLRPDKFWLQIQSASDGEVSALTSGLSQLPPLYFAKPLIDDVTATGVASTNLRIGFDLRDIAGSLDVEVATRLSAADVHSDLLELAVEGVSGDVIYHSSRGFESRALSGALYGRPLSVEMSPDFASTPDTLLAARLDFDVAARDLLGWRSLPLSLPVDGIAPVHIAVTVADQIAVEIASDLAGMQIDLPVPWGKTRESKAPLKLVWRDRGWAEWEVFWFGRFSAVIDAPGNELATMAVDLTPRTRPPRQKLTSHGAGIRVTGMLPEFDPAAWLNALRDGSVPATGFPPISIDDLRVEQLLWRGNSLGGLNLSVSSNPESFLMDFALPWLRGAYRHEFAAPISESAAEFDPKLRPEVVVDYLNIDAIPEFGDRSAGKFADLASAWQPVPVVINDVLWHGRRLGDINFTVTDFQTKSWQFTDVTGNLAGVALLPTSKVHWQQSEDSEITSVSVAAGFSNLESTLTSLGVTPIMQTRSGNLDVDWSWSGSPGQFDLRAISGSMDLKMESGSFTTANAETEGAMRLLSLMNLAGLFRRANMNQLFDPGVTFDRAEGHLEFDEGQLRIPDFSIEGSGGYFNFVSDVDLQTETLDGELVVTLPLVDNIPWVAALAGGLPIAAGTYLVSKVFEEQMNQLSSGVYSVSGDLNDPQVIFERVFDAKATAPPSADQSAAESTAPSPAR
jgi:uncharacterized protein YhdP